MPHHHNPGPDRRPDPDHGCQTAGPGVLKPMPLNRKVFPDHLKVLLIELPSPPLYSLAGLAGSHDTTARLEGGGLISFNFAWHQIPWHQIRTPLLIPIPVCREVEKRMVDLTIKID